MIGLNGSGKSSLLKIIAGIDKTNIGEVIFSPGYTVGYLSQEPELDPNKTVKEVVEEGVAETTALLKEYEAINEKFGLPEYYEDMDKMDKLMARQGELQDKIDAVNAWELDVKLERAMDALRCPDPDAKIAVLSGGERRRVALCRLLLQDPDVLLLDEPTNHLDAESIDWLEQHLKQYKGTVIAVTHDRYFPWITWPAGYWNWTGEKVSRGKVIIRPGWIRKPNVWRRKIKLKANDRKRWNANWSGYAWDRRDAMPNQRRVCPTMINWHPKRPGNAKKNWRCLSHPVRAWGIS